MSAAGGNRGCERSELVIEYALQTLPARTAGELEAHLAGCADCRRQLESLRPLVGRFVSWPTDVLRPSNGLWDRLAERLAEESGADPLPVASDDWTDPPWQNVAPGISVKLLATDTENDRVSMLVRLEPGAAYPSHTHAGVEELHLLDGVLVIDERTLHPGDYNYGEPGAGDTLVWSETGCTCVLITSTRDVLR